MLTISITKSHFLTRILHGQFSQFVPSSRTPTRKGLVELPQIRTPALHVPPVDVFSAFASSQRHIDATITVGESKKLIQHNISYTDADIFILEQKKVSSFGVPTNGRKDPRHPPEDLICTVRAFIMPAPSPNVRTGVHDIADSFANIVRSIS